MSLKTIFSAASDDTLHLLENCLKLNPAARFTATQVNIIYKNVLLIYSTGTQVTILHKKATSLSQSFITQAFIQARKRNISRFQKTAYR